MTFDVGIRLADFIYVNSIYIKFEGEGQRSQFIARIKVKCVYYVARAENK